MTTIEETLDALGIVVAGVGPREITAQCPFHPDSHPSFSMNAKNGLWVCYQCGQGGTIEMLVEKIGGGLETKSFLREVKYDRTKKKAAPSTVDELLEPEETMYERYARYQSFDAPVPEYFLDKRGISQEACDEYGVRWCKGWVLPIRAPEEHHIVQDLWGWQFKRADFVSNYPKAVKKSQTLFGLTVRPDVEAVLVESPLDVVRLAMFGITAVSSFGAFVSKEQLRLLATTYDKLWLGLDNDEEGQAQTQKIFRGLARQMPTKVAQYPDGVKDPGDMTDEQIRSLFL
jgi:DNA primase